MSGLVMWIGRDGRPADREDVEAAATAAAHRGLQARREVQAGAAVAVHLDGGEEADLGRTSPLCTPDRSLLIVADARLDNRDDIAAMLGIPEIAARRDEAALLLEAYRRWGDAFAERLAGDFSIAIWDAPRRRLVAARDRFAMRPLFYRVEPERILVASEVGQILAARGVPVRPFEPLTAAVLAGGPGRPEWTFYEGIERLPPGYTLVVDEAGARLHAHAPLGQDDAPMTSGEWTERLRAGLSDAVRARLEVVRSPGLLLSGGLDSTSIAGTAGVLRRNGHVPAALVAYGWAYDELRECDESGIADAVAAAYGFPCQRVPADTAWPLAEHPAHGPDRDAPDRLRSHVLFARTLSLARRDGVRSLLSGFRGDALLGGQIVDHLGCLVEQGPSAFWCGISEHSRRTGATRRAILAQHALRRVPSLVWPRGRASIARGLVWTLTRSERAVFPPWLRPEAIRRFGLRDIVGQEVPRSRLRGEARRRRHDDILDPSAGRNAEGLERVLARHGIRYGDPWADRRLADLVLRMPQYVITPAGEPKRLLREAMRGVLPEPVRLAARKRPPRALYDRGLAERSRAVVWSLIEGSQAAARGLVDEDALRAAYGRFVARPDRVREGEWRWLWRFVNVEDWLRRFHH